MANTLGDFLVGELKNLLTNKKFIDLSASRPSVEYRVIDVLLGKSPNDNEVVVEYGDQTRGRYPLHIHLNDPIAKT